MAFHSMKEKIADGVAGFIQAFKGRDPKHPFKMLLIGETGSGKTSLLNLLCNCGTVQALGCGFGADGFKNFRQFHDIKLENAMDHAMESKTNDAKRYNVDFGNLKVVVIDTPGFGDSRGFDQDVQNSEKIVNLLKVEKYINCVCLIINGRQARASASLKYVLSEITSILPRAILDNVIVVFSNTNDILDLTFEPNSLAGYFGKKVEHMFFIENPYCRFEKAQSKVEQFGIDLVARSLQKSFEDTAKVLGELCTTIETFPEVHTNEFVELYEKKQAIQDTVIVALTEYENQMRLAKEIQKKKEEVDAALGRKEGFRDFRKTRRHEEWVPIPTPNQHNTLCTYSGCHSNCHAPCYLPKSYDNDIFRYCAAMGGSSACSRCGHSYDVHYHGEKLFEFRTTEEPDIDRSMEAKFKAAKTDQERAQVFYNKLKKQKQASETKRQQLSVELLKTISEFETLGIARNYIKLMENQLAVIDTHIKASIGSESKDLEKTRDELKKKLEVVQQAKEKK